MRGSTGFDRDRFRLNTMENMPSPFEYRDMDCSGRSLATLLIAWVGAAMVASILLQWKYMWIALAVLSLLFLFVCGYTACTARRTQERALVRQGARVAERERRQEREIETVSGTIDNTAPEGEPPVYQTYWVTDLPPSYASVIGAEHNDVGAAAAAAGGGISHPSRIAETEESSSLAPPRLSNPPPYSIAIESEPIRHNLSGVQRAESSQSPNIAEAVNDYTAIEIRPEMSSLFVSKLDKTEEREVGPRITQPNQTASTATTIVSANCLSNIFNYTFGRNQRTLNDAGAEPEVIDNRNHFNTNHNSQSQQSSSESERIVFAQNRRTAATAITRCNSF